MKEKRIAAVLAAAIYGNFTKLLQKPPVSYATLLPYKESFSLKQNHRGGLFMNTKRKLRLFIQLSMLGALSMGITSTMMPWLLRQHPPSRRWLNSITGCRETADNGAITILPINRAKFWAGQRFDLR